MTPKSLGKPCLARCSDQSSAEPCGSASIMMTRLRGPLPREMQGERGLADAALLIEERDDHGATAGIESRMTQAEGR
jgi:hypothetical protein